LKLDKPRFGYSKERPRSGPCSGSCNTLLFTLKLRARAAVPHHRRMNDTPLELTQWTGRSERRTDDVGRAAQQGLWTLLDHEGPGPQAWEDALPLSHWLYFVPTPRQSEIGEDGHPRRGGFLPPVPLPRRMWAGSSIEFHHALRVGDQAVRESRIDSVTAKSGRSGELVFVAVRHELVDSRGLALSETQNIVYRGAPRADASAPVAEDAPADDTFRREIVPDPVLLFRYSALTGNGHRIHYDRPYATQVEGYPGLVVHGPLIATLLIDLLRRQLPQATICRFAFKAVSPLFDIHRFTVCGRADGPQQFSLWARNHEGRLAMQAGAEIA
jgi:3-methylfumaryl-CoA hydratase